MFEKLINIIQSRWWAFLNKVTSPKAPLPITLTVWKSCIPNLVLRKRRYCDSFLPSDKSCLFFFSSLQCSFCNLSSNDDILYRGMHCLNFILAYKNQRHILHTFHFVQLPAVKWFYNYFLLSALHWSNDLEYFSVNWKNLLSHWARFD